MFKDQTAIVGIGQTEFSKNIEKTKNENRGPATPRLHSDPLTRVTRAAAKLNPSPSHTYEHFTGAAMCGEAFPK